MTRRQDRMYSLGIRGMFGVAEYEDEVAGKIVYEVIGYGRNKWDIARCKTREMAEYIASLLNDVECESE